MDSATSQIDFPYSELIKVRYRDTDAQGHLYFANYLVYADEVLSCYLAELGFDAMNPKNAPCFAFAVNIQCDYVKECDANEMVKFSVGYTRLGNSSVNAIFKMEKAECGTLLAKGSLTQVFVDKVTRKSCPIPLQLRIGLCERQPHLAD